LNVSIVVSATEDSFISLKIDKLLPFIKDFTPNG